MVELYISGKQAKAAYDALLKQKAEVEKMAGETLDWDRNEGKDASRVAKKFHFDIFDSTEKHDDVKEKAFEAMLMFIRVFKDGGVVRNLRF